MNAARMQEYGGKEVVVVDGQSPEPTLSAGKVIVEIHAAGVNPVDWKVREGYLQKVAPLSFPLTLGGDFSGVVTEVGEGVTDFTKGQDVFGSASVLQGGTGSFAERALANAHAIAPKPEKNTHLQAAALPLAAVSAWLALVEHMGVSPGQKVLVHGGAGGIGSFAIQIASYLDAYVATTVSADCTAMVKELGADEVIDYERQAFDEILHDYDAVLDTVGGETCNRSFSVLKKKGILVSMLGPPDEKLTIRHEVTAIGQNTLITTQRLTAIANLVDSGALKARIDSTFALKEAAEALEDMKHGHHKGKIVMTVKE